MIELTVVTIAELAEALGASYAGDGSLKISRAVHPLDADGQDAIAMATGPDFVKQIVVGATTAAILVVGEDWESLGLKAALFVERPRFSMSKVTETFARPETVGSGVHSTAHVSASAKLGKNASIGPFVTIGDDVEIGDNACIMSHCSIARGTEIGNDVVLYPGVRIGVDATIGSRVIIHQNAVIGSDGFSFVTPERGAVEAAKESGEAQVSTRNTAFARIHSLASVTLGDDTEVGACSTIDSGTLRDTVVGHGTKIDNQVQIAHNVQIGSGCLLCAQVGLAGSVEVGDRVVLGGKAGVADHVKIGSDVLVAAASAVAGNIPSRRIVMGAPAVNRDEAMNSLMTIRRLPRLFRTVEKLKEQISTNKDSQ